MKTMTMLAAVFAATCSLAMPTNQEIEKAGAEVQAKLQKQLIKWLDGRMSDAEMANLLLMMADKEKDEACHYVCLQGAFAAFVRSGDADTAVETLKRLRAETNGFTPEVEKSVVDKAVEKASGQVALAIRSALAAPAGEYRDEYFGRLDAKSAAVLRRMKSAKIDKMAFDTDSKPGQTAVWILEQVGRFDRGEDIAYTLHEVPEKMKHPIYVSNITCYDALTSLFGACDCSAPQIFIKDGRVQIWFSDCDLSCQYEVVHDETAERIFGEIEEDGFPKCLNFYSDGNGKPPSRHWISFYGRLVYERNGARGILKVGAPLRDWCEIMCRFKDEGLECTLLSREISDENEIKGWKHVRRYDDESLKKMAEREKTMKMMEEARLRRSTLLSRSTLLNRRNQAPLNKNDGAGEAGDKDSANKGKTGK